MLQKVVNFSDNFLVPLISVKWGLFACYKSLGRSLLKTNQSGQDAFVRCVGVGEVTDEVGEGTDGRGDKL